MVHLVCVVNPPLKSADFESERFSGIESPTLTSNYTKKPKSEFRLKGKVKRLQPTPNVFTVSDANYTLTNN